MRRMGVAVLVLAVLLTASLPLAAQTVGKAWGEKWKAENKRWIAYHLIGIQPDRLIAAKRLIAEGLAPLGFNVLILEIDYGFQFKSHPELEATGLNKAQVREFAEVCRKHGIRLIPLMNCLGHQSWGARPGTLLKRYPEFDETPSIPQNDMKIYCREWCPSHPDVNKVVFELIDELIDAFDADAFHVGMDEVFLIGDKNCPRCKGKDVGELFAKVVNELHDHLVGKKGVEMLMWSDRFLDSKTTGYGRWEASDTGSHRAIDRVPRDIILCDWHYEMPAVYQKMGQKEPFPSVRFFQEEGFRILPAPWRNPESATAFLRVAQQGATDKMLGMLFTGWSVSPDGLLAGLKSEPKPFKLGKKPSGAETTQGVAATIQACLKALKTPSR
jgi:hypothetical protein